MTHDNPDPVEALAAIQRAQKDVHRKVGAGSWRYDITYSAVIAGMIGSQALGMPLSTLGVAIGVMVLMIMLRRESDRLGVMVTGVSPRRARWVAFGLGMVLLGMMLAMIVLESKAPSVAILAFGTAVIMVLSFVVALAASRLWLRVYRRETGIDQ